MRGNLNCSLILALNYLPQLFALVKQFLMPLSIIDI